MPDHSQFRLDGSVEKGVEEEMDIDQDWDDDNNDNEEVELPNLKADSIASPLQPLTFTTTALILLFLMILALVGKSQFTFRIILAKMMHEQVFWYTEEEEGIYQNWIQHSYWYKTDW